MADESQSVAVKFSGEGLDVRGVPIYELGDTLVAVQRIIHKAYLFERGRLSSGAKLTRGERARVSLQIGGRRRSSDLYALVPFMSDPVVQAHVMVLARLGLNALAQYAVKRVLMPSRPSVSATASDNTLENSVFIGAIYAESVQITNHINNIGGIDSVTLSIGNEDRLPVEITADTQAYVRSLADVTYPGDVDELVASVSALHPDRLMAEVRREDGRVVKVRMTAEHFDFIRYRTQPGEILRFRGRPLLRFGKVGYSEFEANWVTLNPSE